MAVAPAVAIDELRPEHWPGVARVYAEGIATGHATFETEVPSWEDWDAAHLPDHRFVALRDGEVVGWVAVSPVSDRCVYGGVVENSVYVGEGVRGQGIGLRLLEQLAASTGGGRHLDDPDRDLPGERRERSPPPACPLRGRRAPEAPRQARRRMARRAPARAAQRDRRLMV